MILILGSEIHDKVVVCLNYYLGIRIEDEVFCTVSASARISLR